MLYLELKTSILPLLEGNDKRQKMNSNKIGLNVLSTNYTSKMFEQLRYIHSKYNKSARSVCMTSVLCVQLQLFQ